VDIALAVRKGNSRFWTRKKRWIVSWWDGQPDWDLFRRVIGDALRALRPRTGTGSIRAYGEMVGLLWGAESYEAAGRLEEYWNRCSKAAAFCFSAVTRSQSRPTISPYARIDPVPVRGRSARSASPMTRRKRSQSGLSIHHETIQRFLRVQKRELPFP